MANGRFALRHENDPESIVADARTLYWPTDPGGTDTVRSELGWLLQPMQGVPNPLIDLVRVAACAYMSDRLTRRGVFFSRDMTIDVRVTDVAVWTAEAIFEVQGLLHWLTGDAWTLGVHQDDQEVDPVLSLATGPAPVSLLSGGLDSYLGALNLLNSKRPVRFVGHRDSATAVQSAQKGVEAWLGNNFDPVPSYSRFALREHEKKIESSSRSRSLLFVALGAAVAASTGGDKVYVPENGFTSLNMPLHPNRGGALSTRSTHPDTFRRVNLILRTLGIDVSAENPFQDMTKGEAMALVHSQGSPDGWEKTAGLTISCSKLDGNYLGGSPVLNCGVCVACVTRRATFLRSGIPDSTIYLIDSLTGSNRADLIFKRRSDLDALRYAIERGVDEDAIDSGTWPENYDLDAVSDLVGRGLRELALVPLP